MRPAAVAERLRRVAELADLDPRRRLDTKIDYSPDAITRRLRMVARLSDLCRSLGNRSASVR